MIITIIKELLFLRLINRVYLLYKIEQIITILEIKTYI